MKKVFKIIAGILVVFLLFWLGSVAYAGILTALYADEFTDYEKMNYDFLHAWDDPANIRVLHYGGNEATVYFYTHSGGEKIKFVRGQDGWVYREMLAIWSRQGSADDYFIWPYFKDYGP